MYKIFPIIRNGEKYIFNKFFGFVISIPTASAKYNLHLQYPDYIINPFLMESRRITEMPKISKFAIWYAQFLVYAWKYCYPLIYLFSHLRFSLYEDAGVANLVFRQITSDKSQRILCLPRSVFIATTSKKFSESGEMFIGCFFPSRHMHAWVIEDGMPADIYDNQWTQFTPLVIMRNISADE